MPNNGFSIGVGALNASRYGLDVAGQNIANATNPAYRRRTADIREAATGGSAAGNGVVFRGALRIMDSQLEARARDEQGRGAGLEDGLARLQEVEAVVGRLDNATLSERLNDLLAEATTLTGAADQLPARASFLDQADRLATEMRNTASELAGLRDGARDQASSDLTEVNQLLGTIAGLNRAIAHSTVQKAPNDLLDQRDQAIRELARFGEVRTRSTENGMLAVSLGSATVVSSAEAKSLQVIPDAAGGFHIEASTGERLRLTSGRLHSQETFASQGAGRFADDLDRLAQGLIQAINGIQATGVPLAGPGSSMTSQVGVADPLDLMSPEQIPLSRAGLVGTLRSGTVYLRVVDPGTGAATQYAVALDAESDSLGSLAQKIRAGTPIDAQVQNDGRLSLTAPPGLTIDLAGPADAAPDETGLLGALGFQALFTGSGAADIAVRDAVQQDPSLLALSQGGGAGDSRNAVRLAELASNGVFHLDGFSLPVFLSRAVGGLGAEVSMQSALSQGSKNLGVALEGQRQAVSGVSIDEEVTHIVEFEQSFRAAARFLQSVADTLQTLMDIGR